MFETSVVKAQADVAPRRAGLFTISIALHSVAILAVLAVSIAAVEFPTNAPHQIAVLTIAAPVSLPPAAGNPNGGGKRAQALPKAAIAPKPATPSQATAPTVVPAQVTAMQSATPAAGDVQAGDGNVGSGDGPGTEPGQVGQPDGVEGGVGIRGSSIGSTGPAPAEETIYRVGADVTAPRVLRRVTPRYPQIMVQNRIAAVVMVKCVVGRDGRVRDVEVVRSSYAPFNDAVVDAIRQWTFAPGTLRGTPVDTYFELTARFGLQ